MKWKQIFSYRGHFQKIIRYTGTFAQYAHVNTHATMCTTHILKINTFTSPDCHRLLTVIVNWCWSVVFHPNGRPYFCHRRQKVSFLGKPSASIQKKLKKAHFQETRTEPGFDFELHVPVQTRRLYLIQDFTTETRPAAFNGNMSTKGPTSGPAGEIAPSRPWYNGAPSCVGGQSVWLRRCLRPISTRIQTRPSLIPWLRGLPQTNTHSCLGLL